jgi:hypothetical protein
MKRYNYMIFFVILFFTTPVLMAQDLAEGFSGIKWKTSIDDLHGLTQIGDNGPVSYYTNPNELHKFFEEDVAGVIYGFYKGELFAVFIKIDSLEMFSKIRAHLTAKYGDPEKTMTAKVEQTIYKWKHDLVKIKLKILDVEGTMKLVYYYTPLSNKLNEDDLEAQQRKTPRLFPLQKGKVPDVVPLFEY